MSSSNPFCFSEDNPILAKQDKSIKERKIKKKVVLGKVVKYETTKKVLKKCVYLKDGKCSLKKKPVLCEAFPVFFDINLEDNSIIWLKYKRKKLSQKKLRQAKNKLKKFMEKENVWKILLYIILSKNYNLKPIEEEKIPEKISGKLKKIKKKLREIHEGKKIV